VEPGSAPELLGEDWVQRRPFGARSLTKTSLDAIWLVWDELRSHLGHGKQPLCPSHFDKEDGWKDYFPQLFKILQDIDQASGRKKPAPASPVDQPSESWARREVQEILKLTMPELRAKSRRKRHGSKTVEKAASKSSTKRKSRAKKKPPSKHKWRVRR
jgi:hypothetical protein